ncbi:MAG: FeoA domain-containing protein [Candidatus Eisenbacteria bacterium]|nr:FeoA domain-containing protein [Candidatus Eisenbacteria bacterium]
MSLGMAKTGQRVRVVSIDAGRSLQARLSAMGILPGVELTVMSGGARGPIVVAVRESRVVLGRGMAQRIDVV